MKIQEYDPIQFNNKYYIFFGVILGGRLANEASDPADVEGLTPVA